MDVAGGGGKIGCSGEVSGGKSCDRDIMPPPRRFISDFSSKKLDVDVCINEDDVFTSLRCEEKVNMHYFGDAEKPTLLSPFHGEHKRKSLKRLGSHPSAKRLRSEQTELSMNVDKFNDAGSITMLIGSETNQFPPSNLEKLKITKKKRHRDGKSKKNRESKRSKCDSLVAKTTVACSDSTSGGNIVLGTTGFKSVFRGATKHVDDPPLNELLDGSYKYSSTCPDKGKKTLNANENVLHSVQKSVSVFPSGAIDINRSIIDSLQLPQPNSYPSGIPGLDDRDAYIKDSVLSNKASLGEPIVFQPKVALEKLGLSSDLDALLNLSMASHTLQSTKNVTTPSHASLPPFPWSYSHSGSWKLIADNSKLSSNRNTSHGRWVRIGCNSASGGDYQNSSSEMELNRYHHEKYSINQQKIVDLLQDVKNLTATFRSSSSKMLNSFEVDSSDSRLESVSKKLNFLQNSASDVTLRSRGDPSSVKHEIDISLRSYDSEVVEEQLTEGTPSCSASYTYPYINAAGGYDQNRWRIPESETFKSGHSPRAVRAAEILCDIWSCSGSISARSISGKTKWPKAPSEKTMKARKSTTTEKNERFDLPADQYDLVKPSFKHKSSSEKNGFTQKNLAREPIRWPVPVEGGELPAKPSVKHKSISEKNGFTWKKTPSRGTIMLSVPVENGEYSARLDRDRSVRPRSSLTNPIRNATLRPSLAMTDDFGSQQNLRRVSLKTPSLGSGGTYIKDWSSRGRTKRI